MGVLSLNLVGVTVFVLKFKMTSYYQMIYMYMDVTLTYITVLQKNYCGAMSKFGVLFI